jgi:hypothetical protein
MPQVAMLTWAYFAALLTDPGEVPVGWHPFPDDAVGWRQRALWWLSTVLAAAVAAGQPVDVQWVQGFTLQLRGSVHAAAVQPPFPTPLTTPPFWCQPGQTSATSVQATVTEHVAFGSCAFCNCVTACALPSTAALLPLVPCCRCQFADSSQGAGTASVCGLLH